MSSILPLGHVSSKIRLIRPGVSPAQFSLSVQNSGLKQRHFHFLISSSLIAPTSNHNISNSLYGEHNEIFDFSGEFNHTKAASTLVSSSKGLGATTGKIEISNNGKSINLLWDPGECAVMPMLRSTSSHNRRLARVFFSMKEVDDSAKFPANIGRFSLSIVAS